MKQVRLISAAFILLLLWTQTLVATTYYVSPGGSDSNSGTQAQPFRTIQKGADKAVAGDVVLVQPGDYGEYVTTKASGSEGSRITFRANGAASLRAFRINNQHVTLDGFRFAGAQNLWISHIRIDASSHHAVVTNCFIGPGVFAITDDLVFDHITESVSSPSVDWSAVGFVAGGKVFTGGSGIERYWYKNHDKAWTITSISNNTMYLSGNWLNETNTRAWAPVYAGANSAGIEGIIFIPSGGNAATNCVIVGNTFSNLFGPAITLQGLNHTVAQNTFTKLNSYYGVRPNGGGHRIYSNLWYDCTTFLHYSPQEFGEIPHPLGASWYDYQVGFIHATGALNQGATNVHFFRNWIENSHNQLGQINELPNAYGFHVYSNVFVGVYGPLSGGRNGLTFTNNTFYRVNYDAGSAAINVGGNTAQKRATNIFVQRNVFVDVGNHRNLNLEGFYSVINVVDSMGNSYTPADFNFVAGPETAGWDAKNSFTEANGINGGDPLFLDAENPRGPDGVPFTSDDGLRPLPGSHIALRSLGALEPVKLIVGTPISHFTISTILSGLGWHDKVGLEFDPLWETLAPFHRTNKVRPYFTPEALGYAPVSVQFSAANSISGVTQDSRDWTGINGFTWDFGDGTVLSTQQPFVEHTFKNGGRYIVQLTVTNTFGISHASRKTFRVLQDGSVDRPLPPSGLRIASP